MTVLTSLGRVLAVGRGQAQPIAAVRHLHISQRPLVFIPLKMAGEANAPMAAMVGTDRRNPQLLVVAQPRNRDQRFAFAHRLARIILAEILPMAERRTARPIFVRKLRWASPPEPPFVALTHLRSGYPTALASSSSGCSAGPPACVKRRGRGRSRSMFPEWASG